MAKTRNVVLAVGCSLLAVFALCAGLVGGCVYFVAHQIDENDFLNDTIERVSSHPEVIAELGTPIERSWTNVRLNTGFGGRHHGEVEITIEGPGGRGRLEARGERRRGDDEWDYEYLRVRLDAGWTIDLLE